MKTFLFPFITFCLLLSNGSLSAQIGADEVIRQTLLVSLKKHDEKNSSFVLKTGAEAANFDIEKFIAENIQLAEVQISGKKISYGKTEIIEFDSRKMEVRNDCNQFCKSIVSVSKNPILGLTVSPMDDLQGVLVETIYEGSSAEQAGIQQGDMVTFVEQSIIQSGCDLIEAVEEVEVGDVLDVYVEVGDEKKILPVILNYKLKEIVTYEYCCNSEIEIESPDDVENAQLSIFPNPTDGISQLKFRSSEKTDLKISLTDVAGHQIFKTEVKEFDGFFNEVLDLTDFAAGLYFVQVIQGQQVWTEKIVLQNL